MDENNQVRRTAVFSENAGWGRAVAFAIDLLY